DADHDLGAGDEGAEQIAAGEPALLSDRKAGGEQDRARMHARSGLGEVVEFERVGERAVREGGGLRLHQRSAAPEDAAPPPPAPPAPPAPRDAPPPPAP